MKRNTPSRHAAAVSVQGRPVQTPRHTGFWLLLLLVLLVAAAVVIAVVVL